MAGPDQGLQSDSLRGCERSHATLPVDLAMVHHLTACATKLLFFCREFAAELLPEPENLEECYRWGREFLEFFDHGFVLVKLAANHGILQDIEGELKGCRSAFALDLVGALRISNGRIHESPLPSSGIGGECDRRLKSLCSKENLTNDDSQAISLLRKIAEALQLATDRVLQADGVHVELLQSASSALCEVKDWLKRDDRPSVLQQDGSNSLEDQEEAGRKPC